MTCFNVMPSCRARASIAASVLVRSRMLNAVALSFWCSLAGGSVGAASTAIRPASSGDSRGFNGAFMC
jgi:hypothetical protein